MKTLISCILLASLVILTSIASVADKNYKLPLTKHSSVADADTLGSAAKPVMLIIQEEEPYVEDIPFSTKEISEGYLVESLPAMDPESYIDDIPFETGSIANRFLPAGFLGIFFESESYIDDIPFNTCRIAENYLNRELSKYCCKTF
ncbi:MAG: hypothetical protein V1775_14350 [Bacteroidota bacterium]